MSDITNLSPKQKEVYDKLPDTRNNIAEELEISARAVRYRMNAMENHSGIQFERNENGIWSVSEGSESIYSEDGGNIVDGNETDSDHDSDHDTQESEESDEKLVVKELGEVEVETEPNIDNLTTREEYILGQLETGSTIDELADDLGIRRSVVRQNLKEVKRRGWDIYHDKTADRIAIESDHPIRSSEHKGTRTRKANRWWELNHNQLVREFRGLQRPSTKLVSNEGNEDWVTHMTDLHAGDIVRTDSSEVTYETDMIPDIIDYITNQSLSLSDKHDSQYDTAHLLWGGDFLTGEAIYEGQFEDLDAWLDEQHSVLMSPLIRQIKAFSEEFETVQVVCQVGNHGQHRASGTSRQANADLILYKSIRNTISEIIKYSEGILENVEMLIGQAKPYRNFNLRGGKIDGHLRHGENRNPQAETSARSNEWRGTLIDHNFDICWMGHHHISGRIPWGGPPIFVSPSPKPSSSYVEKLGGRVNGKYQPVATVHGVSDDGVTGVYPVDMRNFEFSE